MWPKILVVITAIFIMLFASIAVKVNVMAASINQHAQIIDAIVAEIQKSEGADKK